MRSVTVRYHQEPEGWWAEADALPTFSAAGNDYDEVRARVWSALPDLIDEPLEIYEDLAAAGIDVPVSIRLNQVGPGTGMRLAASVGVYGSSVTRQPVSGISITNPPVEKTA
jgi:predicted RNase H-like HicB family nuclease